ncbi:MAG: DUF2807 domain-containing protein [Mucilaginibacter polytrichastri]|nr:DUF2807 domain-containing protein [Mucilaginibacter polytrichastri]
MKKIILPALLAALCVSAATVAAPVSEPVKTSAHFDQQNRNVGNFHAINVAGSMDVFIRQTGSISVKVDADKDVIDRIETKVEGGVLKISLKNSSDWKWWKNMGDKKMNVYVTVKDIDGIQLTGSGDVAIDGELKASSLDLSLSGSGDLKGKISAKSVGCSLTGSGDLSVSGRAETSDVRLTGSGDYSGGGLITANTSVRITGSGDASVHATQKLDAHVSGSGDIRYGGSPKNVSKSTSGSGDISQM